MDGKKWGVGYKEKWDCYFIEESGTPGVFYLFEEELKTLQSMVKEGTATLLKTNMNNSQIVTALLDLMCDFRDVIDENCQEEAERLFKIAYELIYSID